MSMNFLFIIIILIFIKINEKIWSKIMFGLIKKIFVGLLIDIVNASNHKKCISLSNEKC